MIDDEETAARILQATRSIAVVGASDNPARDSYRVMAYLLRAGFRVIPVNPMVEAVLGIPAVPQLSRLGETVDTVVCFRRSEEIVPIANEAVQIGARHLWMQYGVINDEAERLAKESGMLVVMDRCIMVDHRRLKATAQH